MILSLLFISSTLALFITPQKWIERRIGSIRPNQKSSREIVSIRAPNQNFYKSHEKILKKEICNIQTCSKCVSLLSYSATQNFKLVELCEQILSLRSCCPQQIVLHARFWNLKIPLNKSVPKLMKLLTFANLNHPKLNKLSEVIWYYFEVILRL